MADQKPAKYLTQIKELPNEAPAQEQQEDLPNEKEVKLKVGKQESNVEPQPLATESKKKEEKITKPSKKVKPERSFTAKDVILGIINLVAVSVLVYLLTSLPARAKELKSLRNNDLATKQKVSVKLAEIEPNQEKSDEIRLQLADESGLVDFVKEIEEIKSSGSVTGFTFTSQQPVKDPTGNFGIPVVITFRGTWTQIGEDMARIQKLPYIFRAVKIESNQDEEDATLVNLRYGGLLYVQDQLAKGR